MLPAAQEVTRSRFFASDALNATKKMKRAKKADFGIYSDDSVEEILTQLPDITQHNMAQSPKLRDREKSRKVEEDGLGSLMPASATELKGSEDLIVPNSEDEEELDLPRTDQS